MFKVEGDFSRLTVPAQSNDAATTIATLREVMQVFVEEREWEQFHSPKNLAISLAIEAAELMEHVQWLETTASREIASDEARKFAMGEEIADAFCYLLALCNVLQLDLTQAMLAKMQKNRDKYPVSAFRGRYGEEDTGPPAQ